MEQSGVDKICYKKAESNTNLAKTSSNELFSPAISQDRIRLTSAETRS